DLGRDLGRPDLGGDIGAPDLGPDLGPPCSGASTCFLAGGATATGACIAATTASCAPPGTVDCDCAPSADARLFFDPPSGAGGRLQHVVVSGAGLADLSL